MTDRDHPSNDGQWPIVYGIIREYYSPFKHLLGACFKFLCLWNARPRRPGSKPWSYTGGRSLNMSRIYQTPCALWSANGPMAKLDTLNENLESAVEHAV